LKYKKYTTKLTVGMIHSKNSGTYSTGTLLTELLDQAISFL